VKRTVELKPLSRDHHKALTAAQRLIRASDAGASASEFLDFWRSHGRHHFQIEEEILLPSWFEHDANADLSMADRLTREHLEIRTTVRRIEQGGVRLDALHELGDLLTRHVRFEERELFARIEAGLDPAALAALGDEIAAAESHTN
jgi:hemerythrin-like domain-containing protein